MTPRRPTTGRPSKDDRPAELDCLDYSPSLHAPGSKGADGRCSWTEHCAEQPTVTVEVQSPGRPSPSRFALCHVHHLRVHQYYRTVNLAAEDEVTHLLHRWAAGFAGTCRATPTHPEDGSRTPRLALGRRGVEPDEAAAFLRVWRAELVDISGDGTFTLPKVRTCPPALHLVGRSGNGVALHTEYLVHLGSVAELVEDHGWHLGDLAFEQGEWDILGLDADRVTLAVEAKARALRPATDSLESLRDSLLARSRDPEVVIPANHDRKWRALADYCQRGPVVVLLVASGARWWFTAESCDGRLVVESTGR